MQRKAGLSAGDAKEGVQRGSGYASFRLSSQNKNYRSINSNDRQSFSETCEYVKGRVKHSSNKFGETKGMNQNYSAPGRGEAGRASGVRRTSELERSLGGNLTTSRRNIAPTTLWGLERSYFRVLDPQFTRKGISGAMVLPNGHGRPATCLSVDHNTGRVVTGSADHGLRLYRLPEGPFPSPYDERGVDDQFSKIPETFIAELYGKTWGHTEWVTCCSFTSDGRVISGGMDGKLCLWNTKETRTRTFFGRGRPSLTNGPRTEKAQDDRKDYVESDRPGNNLSLSSSSSSSSAVCTMVARPPEPTVVAKASSNRTRCVDLVPGHRSGVSDLKIGYGLEGTPLCTSIGYDGSIRVYNLNTNRQVVTLSLLNHFGRGGSQISGNLLSQLAPLQKMVWVNSMVCTGDKQGGLAIWDVSAEKLVATVRAAHVGSFGDLQLLRPPYIYENSSQQGGSIYLDNLCPYLASGGVQDGRVAIFDLRCISKPVVHFQAHAASVNSVIPTDFAGTSPACGSGVCTVGADGYAKIWDLRFLTNNFEISKKCCARALVEINAKSSNGFLSASIIDDKQGLVCGAAANGAIYLLDFNANSTQEKIPWAYGCSSVGALHALEVLSGDKIIEEKNNSYRSINCASGVVTAGDDGHLTVLAF